MFAKANIPCGSRVIAEPALLDVKGGNAKDIVRAFESLPSSQQSLYLELHGYACEPFKRAGLFALDQKLAMNIRIGGGTSNSYKKGLEMAQKIAAIQKSEGLLNRELRVS